MRPPGIIGWFADNHVTANLMMFFILLTGLYAVFTLKKESFPPVHIDAIDVRVLYLGAAPEEVEEGVIIKIEEAIEGIEGIREIQSIANEGFGQVSARIEKGFEVTEVMDEIKLAVDGISTFPSETERPVISRVKWQRGAIAVQVGGDLDESADPVAVVIQQPSFFGTLEDVDRLTDWAHQQGALVIGIVNPTSLALLKAPGHWGEDGADIACGEGQPLGVPLSSGGPYFGFMTCKKKYVRQMPGRIVGRTTDLNDQPGYALTLQAREQHIRRSKATSNICTNQGLMVTAATIYLSLLGFDGLAQVARRSQQNVSRLAGRLTAIEGVERLFEGPHFHELVLRLDRPVAAILDALADRDILGGYNLADSHPELGNALLICATETKTEADMDAYVTALGELFTNGSRRSA